MVPATLRELDLQFARHFHCEVLDEIPNVEDRRRHFFPEAGRDGLLLRMTPRDAESWIGTFAFGAGRFSRVLSLPDPEKVCVVSRGEGYIVSARDPRAWEALRFAPITDARAAPAAGVVVFAKLTEMMAYGATGVRWRTGRLAWDGLKILEVTGKSITGES
jgi:hypothetical protein